MREEIAKIIHSIGSLNDTPVNDADRKDADKILDLIRGKVEESCPEANEPEKSYYKDWNDGYDSCKRKIIKLLTGDE